MKKTIKIGKQRKKAIDAEVMTLLGKSGHIVKVLTFLLDQAKTVDNRIREELDYGLR